MNDEEWMARALELAYQGQAAGEVPVGAVLVKDDKLLSEAYNQPISLCDPTAHAEILALRAAAKTLGNYRLLNTTLYVTLEPCPMCAMALIHARVERVVFAASDPKTGAAGSVYSILGTDKLNHKVEVVSGVCEQQAADLLKQFFLRKRNSISS